MVDYYHRRAAEYEAIYRRPDPARAAELEALGAAMRRTLAGRRVLEVACGTGFWTERVAAVARSVVAVDAAPGVLEIARARGLPAGRVRFVEGDAYRLDRVATGETVDAGLAAFFVSHVPRARLGVFLDGLPRRLGPGAPVVLADNVYLPGVGGELVAGPGADTYKLRRLADGSEHRVLKNYLDDAELEALLGRRSRDLRIRRGDCYWRATYVIC
jgi:SAM-dependent methyltransferase